MGVSNTGGGGASSMLSGTAATRPTPVAAGPNKLYWATDTNEITFSDGAAWHDITQIGSDGNSLSVGANNFGALQIAGTPLIKMVAGSLQFQNVWRSIGAQEAAGATAGGGAAPPATVQGYFVFTDSGGATRKIPYYAN